jgi:F-type H+-transporting ATPase subunit gamma
VSIVYNPGKGPEVVRLLPLEVGAVEGGHREYDYLPDLNGLLETLLPLVLRQRLFRHVLRGMAGEQQARMGAMHAATDAAEDMITALTRRINRVRQSQITKELSEIISGAEAQG